MSYQRMFSSDTEISSWVKDPFTLRSWPLSNDGLFLWYMYNTFCDRTSAYKVKFIDPRYLHHIPSNWKNNFYKS